MTAEGAVRAQGSPKDLPAPPEPKRPLPAPKRPQTQPTLDRVETTPEPRDAPASVERPAPELVEARARPPSAEQQRLVRRIEDAGAIIADPARNVPELREGQGVVRHDGRSATVEWRIKGFDGDQVVLQDYVRSNGPERRMSRAELLGLVTQSGDRRYDLREGPATTSPRVQTAAERAYAYAVRDARTLMTTQIGEALGERDARIYSSLATRHQELALQRERESAALLQWMSERRPFTESWTRPIASAVRSALSVPSRTVEEAYGDAPQREPLARLNGQIADVERAMTGLVSGRGIDFTPQSDAITFALRQYRDGDAATPSLVDRTRLNAALLADASEGGRVLDGWAAYHATVQPYLHLRGADGGSFHSVRDNDPSLTYAVNRLVGNKVLGDRRLVVSADQLAALRPQIEANWSAVVAMRDSLRGPGVSTGTAEHTFDAEAARALDAEVTRLRGLESAASHRELLPMARQANERVPALVAAEPSHVRQFTEAGLRLFDRTDVLAMAAVSGVTLGAGSATLGGMGVAGTSAELLAAARAGNFSWRALATLRGAGVLASEATIDGAAFHAGMNVYYGLTNQDGRIDTSAGGFARSIAMMGVARLAGMAHVARAAEMSPGIMRSIGEPMRHFGEELAGIGMLSAVETALRSGRPQDALHELESNAQMMLGMRLGAAARGLHRAGPPASSELVAQRTIASEAEMRRLIENGAGHQEVEAAQRRLSEAYDAELAVLRSRGPGEPTPKTEGAPSRQELLDRVFAVHSTEVFPTGGVITPGRVLDAAGQQRWGPELGPSFRPSTHFALGELVRPHHADRYSWDGKPFAVVTPLRNIEPQLASVGPHDTWTVGRVRLREGDTVVAPRGTDTSSLPPGVRAFEYDPGPTGLRQAVDTVIRGQDGFPIRMTPDQLSWDAPAMLNGRDVNTPAFFANLLAARPDLSFGSHLYSTQGQGYRFGALDSLMRRTVDPFNGVKNTDAGKLAFSQALMMHHVNALRGWAREHLTPEQRGDFETAARNVDTWMGIARGKARGSPDPVMDEVHRVMLHAMPPADLHAFLSGNPQIRLPSDFWPVYSIARRNVNPWHPPSEEGLPALSQHAFAGLSGNIDLFHHIQNELNGADPSALQRTLGALREPAVRDYLRRHENIDFADGEPRTLEDVLRQHPRTRGAFAPVASDVDLIGRFAGLVANPTPLRSFADAADRASTLSNTARDDVQEARTRSLNTARTDAGGDVLGLYDSMLRDGPLEYFERIGLGGQFRRAYPNPNDLFREQRPLYDVITELQGR